MVLICFFVPYLEVNECRILKNSLLGNLCIGTEDKVMGRYFKDSDYETY